MAVLLDLVAGADAPAAWPEPRYLLLAVGLAFALNPLVNELQPVVERLFPISDAIKAALGELDGPVAEPRRRRSRSSPCPGRLRGARVPRLHPLGAGAAAPDAVGDPALGADVRLPARADEPVPAALQRDAAGDRPGPAGGPEPEHPAGDRLPLPQQCDGRGAGSCDRSTAADARRSPVGSIATPSDGLYHGVWVVAACVLSSGLLYLALEPGSAAVRLGRTRRSPPPVDDRPCPMRASRVQPG